MSMPDSSQINKMRQDAIRRSKEMHSRALRDDRGNEKVKNEAADNGKTPVHSPAGILASLAGDIPGLNDPDKLLIAVLLLLLIREGADIKLILALGYILL